MAAIKEVITVSNDEPEKTHTSETIEEDLASVSNDQIDSAKDMSDMQQSEPNVTKADPEIQAFASHQNNEEGENKITVNKATVQTLDSIWPKVVEKTEDPTQLKESDKDAQTSGLIAQSEQNTSIPVEIAGEADNTDITSVLPEQGNIDVISYLFFQLH